MRLVGQITLSISLEATLAMVGSTGTKNMIVVLPCTQLDHTHFMGKFHIILALCCNLIAAKYAQNYAGIIFASLIISAGLDAAKCSVQT